MNRSDANFEILMKMAVNKCMEDEITLFYSLDVSDTTVSKKTRRKVMNALRQLKLRDLAWMQIVKRVAVVVLVLMSLSFVSVMSVEAVRTAIWKVFLEWRDEYIHIWYDKTENDADVLSEILEYKEPRGIDDEYIRYEGIKNMFTYTVEYESKNHIITYHQDLLGSNGIYVSNENTITYDVMIHQYPGIAMEYEVHGIHMVNLVWDDGEYRFSLSGNVSIDYLMSLAESVS